MTLEQAMENLVNIAQAYKGTFGEHVSLQESIRMVKEAITPKSVEPPKVEELK